MEVRNVGQYTIIYVRELGLATVTVKGILVPVLLHKEDDPDALAKCETWVNEQQEGT